MVVFGVDPHKHSHTVVAVDAAGRKLEHKSAQARSEGHLQLLSWAVRLAPQDRVWAVEDVRHVASNLVRDLLAAGETVVLVPPKMMAGERRGGRERGKSDPIDALAIARLALREPDLSTAVLDEQSRAIRVLVDHRDDLVGERTRVINRLRWHLHALDPDLAPTARTLKQAGTRSQLIAKLQGLPASTTRRIALAQLAHIEALSAEIKAVEDELRPQVEKLAPNLTALLGAGVLTAAKILGEVGDITRFRGPATFARHNGTAPIPVWSANEGRQRLNRGGNRQLNVALHRIAITQARLHQGAKDLLERRKQTTRDTAKGSLRVLKRHLSDVVYRTLLLDHAQRHSVPGHATH